MNAGERGSEIQLLDERVEIRFQRRLLLLQLASVIAQSSQLILLRTKLARIFLDLFLLAAHLVQALNVPSNPLLIVDHIVDFGIGLTDLVVRTGDLALE